MKNNYLIVLYKKRWKLDMFTLHMHDVHILLKNIISLLNGCQIIKAQSYRLLTFSKFVLSHV